jgi:hypothetical protein
MILEMKDSAVSESEKQAKFQLCMSIEEQFQIDLVQSDQVVNLFIINGHQCQ